MSKHQHVQEDLSLKWIITHNLDKFPTVEVFANSDESDTPRKIYPVLMSYVDANTIHLVFSQLRKGFAFLS